MNESKTYTKHTPGEWKIRENMNGLAVTTKPTDTASVAVVAWVPDNRNSATTALPDEALSNARLIAAAPAMLEALQVMDLAFDQCGPWDDPYIKGSRKVLHAALSKATGVKIIWNAEPL